VTFLFLFSQKIKRINFFSKKKNHRLTRGTLTNGVSQLCLKGT